MGLVEREEGGSPVRDTTKDRSCAGRRGLANWNARSIARKAFRTRSADRSVKRIPLGLLPAVGSMVPPHFPRSSVKPDTAGGSPGGAGC